MKGNAPQGSVGKNVEEASPEAANLAVDIVIDSFGQETGTVCKSLIRRGQRTLRELVRDTVRARRRVCDGGPCFLALVQPRFFLTFFLHFFPSLFPPFSSLSHFLASPLHATPRHLPHAGFEAE